MWELTSQKTLGRMRTRENEAEAAVNWVSVIAESTRAATVSNTACSSVNLSTVFQSQPLKSSSSGQWMRH